MARRNVWTPEETRELLTIIKELDLMKLFGEERNTKLYQITENEMKQRGYFDKDAFQIEHKWKNLKRSYYKTKRENYLAESCEYFEELDELMAMKPPAPSSSKSKGMRILFSKKDSVPVVLTRSPLPPFSASRIGQPTEATESGAGKL